MIPGPAINYIIKLPEYNECLANTQEIIPLPHFPANSAPTSSHLLSRNLRLHFILPRPQTLTPTMGSDDYSVVVGGGLKLKGSKPIGVTKKKKKDKDKSKSNDKAKEESTSTALQKALADKEQAAVEENTTALGDRDEFENDEEGDYDSRGSGKTEAERKWEEMRRKRVCVLLFLFYVCVRFLLKL
jgi:protein FAM32A